MNAKPSFSTTDTAVSEGRARPVLMGPEEAYALTREARQFQADLLVLEAALNARPVFVPKSFRHEIAADLKAQRDRLERNRARRIRRGW